MKRTLITGSGGFLAANFIRYCIKNKFDYNFSGIDNVSKTSVLNNVYINKSHNFYIGDVLDKHFLNVVATIEQPNIIIHFADENLNNLEYSNYINNITGTLNLIEVCKKFNAKLVFISSDDVYGECPSFVNEDYCCNPVTNFGISKLSCESFIKASGIDYVIVRPCSIFGHRQNINYLIPKVIKGMKSNSDVIIFGKGQQTRNWLYVLDFCKALDIVINKGKDNIYNISSSQEFYNLEIVSKVYNYYNKGLEDVKVVPDMDGRILSKLTDNAKIKDLGWAQDYKIADAIPLTCQWYDQNNWFIK